MKKRNHIKKLDKLLDDSWLEQMNNELDPADTMNHFNRMNLVTSELAGRLGSIIKDLEKKKKK